MKPHRLLALLALLAFSLANATPTGHLSAASIEATGASATTADLAGLFVFNAPTPAFTLDADRLTVENHHANATLALQTPLGSRYNVAGKPDTLHDGPGLLTGYANRPTEALWVLPLADHVPPTLTATAPDCVSLEPPKKDVVTATAIVNTVEPVWSVNTSRAAAWRTCQDATATIQGDFLFVLWEWDAILTANGESRTLRTGHQDAHPGTPLDGTAGTADELFITVRGGILTLPLAPGAHELYLHAPRVEAASWRFMDAAGSLPAVGDVAGTVHVTGTLAATVTGTGAGAPLAADVAGVPQRVEVNGEPVAVAVPTAPEALRISVAAWVVAGAAVGVVAAGAVAVWAWRRGRVRRNCEAARGATGAGGADVALGHNAGASLRVRDLEAEQRVLRAVRKAPGSSKTELLEAAGLRWERTHTALEALLTRGAVVRCGSSALWLFYPPGPDLEERARRDAALRQEKLWLLRGVLLESPEGMEQSTVVSECLQRFRWSPSTTKGRLRCLAAAGLAEAREARATISVTERVARATKSVTWVAT